jgi:hypothetical protein
MELELIRTLPGRNQWKNSFRSPRRVVLQDKPENQPGAEFFYYIFEVISNSLATKFKIFSTL